jgi:hypothetical protein
MGFIVVTHSLNYQVLFKNNIPNPLLKKEI